MDGGYGRIHRAPFKAVISMLFIAAMLATIGRLALRFRFQKRLFADDYVLLFGCSSLIAAFALTNVMFEDIYFSMSLILGPVDLELQESASAGFGDRILRYRQLSLSTDVICWAIIFSVKTSYLLFFRQLLDRLPSLLNFWKGTVGFVIVSGIFCICSNIFACPHFGVSSIECAKGPSFTRTVAISQLANALNMLTDLLIVAVPTSLLWRVKIRLQQKIILGTFLCLSICMFAICLVRTIGGTIEGNTGTAIDLQWSFFWLLVEASVAVTVVSLTAFRSLYNMQQEQQNKRRYEPWLSSYRKRLSNRRKLRRVDVFGDTVQDEHYSLPSTPGATLTGMRTIIGGKTRKSMQALSARGDLTSIDEAQEEEEPGQIKVVSDTDMHQSFRSYV